MNAYQRTKKKMKYRKYATFNCQGLNSKIKKLSLADDFLHHKLTIMMIQETRIKGDGVYKIKSSNGTMMHFFNSGHQSNSYGGTGFIVTENSKVTFKPISERISLLTVMYGKTKYVFISVYAPDKRIDNHRSKQNTNFL